MKKRKRGIGSVFIWHATCTNTIRESAAIFGESQVGWEHSGGGVTSDAISGSSGVLTKQKTVTNLHEIVCLYGSILCVKCEALLMAR